MHLDQNLRVNDAAVLRGKNAELVIVEILGDYPHHICLTSTIGQNQEANDRRFWKPKSALSNRVQGRGVGITRHYRTLDMGVIFCTKMFVHITRG